MLVSVLLCATNKKVIWPLDTIKNDSIIASDEQKRKCGGDSLLRLKEWRTARGISQKALAREVGVSEITVIRWEKQRTHPNSGQLATLCKVLDAPLDDLLKIERA